MPPASTVYRTVSFTNDEPFHVKALSRSSALFQLEPAQYTKNTSCVLAQSGCIAMPSKPGSLDPLKNTFNESTVS